MKLFEDLGVQAKNLYFSDLTFHCDDMMIDKMIFFFLPEIDNMIINAFEGNFIRKENAA